MGFDVCSMKMRWWFSLSIDDRMEHEQNEQKAISMILDSLSQEFSDKIARFCEDIGEASTPSGPWLWEKISSILA
jgi:hypothetical protein